MNAKGEAEWTRRAVALRVWVGLATIETVACCLRASVEVVSGAEGAGVEAGDSAK